MCDVFTLNAERNLVANLVWIDEPDERVTTRLDAQHGVLHVTHADPVLQVRQVLLCGETHQATCQHNTAE